jgi:hypothetical protein
MLAVLQKVCINADLEKCPHFQKIKDGDFKDIDMDHNDCPLKEKCPYYAEFKKDPSKLEDCPHFTGKDDSHDHSHKTGQCPHMVFFRLI